MLYYVTSWIFLHPIDPFYTQGVMIFEMFDQFPGFFCTMVAISSIITFFHTSSLASLDEMTNNPYHFLDLSLHKLIAWFRDILGFLDQADLIDGAQYLPNSS